MGRRRFALVLEDYPARLRPDMPEPTPAVVRLKILLKQLLRAHGFKCVDAREIQDSEVSDDRLNS